MKDWKNAVPFFLLLLLFGLPPQADAWVSLPQRDFIGNSATVIMKGFCLDRAGEVCQAPNAGTAEEWKSLLREAMSQWNNAGSNFIFREREARPSDHPCNPQPGEADAGNVYVILAYPDTTCYGERLGVDASIFSYGRRKFALIYINIENPSFYSNGVFDWDAFFSRRLSLLLHEFGHVAGLGHPDEAGQEVQAVMNSVVWFDTLQQDDIDGIRALWGTREEMGEDDKEDRLMGALENPQPNSFQSGIALLSGWVCDAEEITLEINNNAVRAIYGAERGDTEPVCGDTNNGFGVPFNWNLLGDGVHTIVARADGIEFARADVTVTTFGEEFLRGKSGEYILGGFPDPDTSTVIVWSESHQNFVIKEVINAR